MKFSNYSKHLNSQTEKNFIKTIDLGFILKQTKDQITDRENNIDKLNKEIVSLQKQLKSADKEAKQQLVAQMKDLGAEKKTLEVAISELVGKTNKYKADLSAMSDAKEFDKKAADFVDYVSDIAINNSKIRAKFEEKIKSNYAVSYLSDYATQLARQIKLHETSGNIYENMITLSSFHVRNSPFAQKIFQLDLVNDIIQSYLKKRNEM